jgi:hypothetical protein
MEGVMEFLPSQNGKMQQSTKESLATATELEV